MENQEEYEEMPQGTIDLSQYRGDISEGFQKFRLDTAELIDTLEHHLKGERLVGEEWETYGDPLLNAEGVKNMITLVSAYVNKDWLMSSPDQLEIEQVMWNFSSTLRMELILHHRDWAVRSIPIIKMMVGDLVWGTLIRCRGGGERKSLGETLRSIERNIIDGAKKAHFWSKKNDDGGMYKG